MRTRLLNIIDYFVSDGARGSRSDTGRERMFVFTHLLGPAMGQSIVFFLFAIDPEPNPECSIIAACIAMFWALPFLLKITGQLKLVALLSVQILLFVTFFGSYFYGGVASPFLPWLLVALLMGFTYLGNQPLLVGSLFTLNSAAFGGVWLTIGAPPERVPLDQLATVGMISVFGATLYVAWMAIYYGFLLSSESDLNREVRLHRETAAKLQRARDEAILADRNKTVFLAKMSHELRTPLNAVIGYSELLLEDADGVDPDGQRTIDLRRINNAGKHLLALVTDVLDLSNIEREQVEVRYDTVSVQSLFESVCDTLQPIVAQRHNRLEYSVAVGADELVSDELKLRQVLLNLIGNAAKFTANGLITVVARRPSSGKWIEIDIKDTGVGIAPDDLASLFQNFSQVGAARSTRRDGTGLGLVVSRNFVTMLGGAISVKSQPGHGSCFSVRLPIERSAPESSAQISKDTAEILQSVAA